MAAQCKENSRNSRTIQGIQRKMVNLKPFFDTKKIPGVFKEFKETGSHLVAT